MDNTDLSYVRWYEKNIILRIIDKYWQNHIDTMDKLRSHTNLVQYAQKNPYQVYTQEGSKKFDEMLSNIAYDAMTEIFKDRLGAESLITSEMENDPIFRQLVDNIILDDMPDDEREELIVNMYKNVKSQIEQNINDANRLRKWIISSQIYVYPYILGLKWNII
nr:hypothetical protein [Mycoplasmopsis bovis]